MTDSLNHNNDENGTRANLLFPVAGNRNSDGELGSFVISLCNVLDGSGIVSVELQVPNEMESTRLSRMLLVVGLSLALQLVDVRKVK